MLKLRITLLCLISFVGMAAAWEKTENGFRFNCGELTRTVEFYGNNSLRVTATLRGVSHAKHPSITVVAGPTKVPLEIKAEGEHCIVAVSPAVTIRADRKSGALAFFRPDGEVILRENTETPVSIKEVTISDAPTYEVKQHFRPTPDEGLYGLGQCVSPTLNLRGQEIWVVQTNIPAFTPVFTSSNRYGILWDIASQSIFHDGKDGLSLWAESAPAGADYYLMTGKDLDAVLGEYRMLTGAAPMFPKQAFGFFMSKERYKSQQELIGIVEEFRRDGFPIDWIVQDWQYWKAEPGLWTSMTWCPERFPNPKEMCDTLHHKLHVKVMASIWPTVGDDSELARELDAKKLRFEPLHWITKKARVYDAYSEEGRSIYFKHMKKGLLDVGVDAMWMDGTEVETRSSCKRPQDMVRDIKENGINAMGDFTRYLNSYSLMTTRGCYEGQRATANKRVLTLTRSAWAGQQRYAALPWSGDTTASWQCLKDQIAGGLSASLSGLPYWTQDTGGFFLKWVLREKNKEYQELLARWNQFGIFNPVYRWHSSGVDREPWRFRESAPEMYDSYRKAAELRYQLLPYIYSLAWQTTVTGAPMTRPVVMDFPGSKGAKDEQTAFLFGPALLTQPVTRPMYHDDAKLPASLIPAEALAPGVRTEYFADTRLKRIVSNCVEPNIDFSWPGPPLVEWPQGLENGENFSCRVTGVLTVPEAGEYRIGITGDSGFRLKFGKRMVINEWRNNTLRTVTTALLLKKDEKLPFEIEYCHSTGPRTLQMVWKTPSMLLKERAEKQDIDNRETTHLPEGADWYDFWSDRFLSGGTEAVTECTLDRFPLFVRAGSILPLGPADLKYATEKPGAPLEIRIYAGADATFEWYEDDNETYDYERGLRATAAFAWDDAAKCLRIGKRQGSFPGMIAERDFRAILIGKDSKRQEQSVRYRGEEVSIQFNKGK